MAKMTMGSHTRECCYSRDCCTATRGKAGKRARRTVKRRERQNWKKAL